jgi:hypothetical protein
MNTDSYSCCPYSTGAALPSVSPINAGIPHAETAAPCAVARDITEVTWSPPTVVRPSSYRVTQQHAERREGKGREARRAALRYCCAIAFLDVSEFYQLPHGAITTQYILFRRNTVFKGIMESCEQ